MVSEHFSNLKISGRKKHKKTNTGAVEMAQPVKVLAAKPDIESTWWKKKKTKVHKLWQVLILAVAYAYMPPCPPPNIHAHIKIMNVILTTL